MRPNQHPRANLFKGTTNHRPPPQRTSDIKGLLGGCAICRNQERRRNLHHTKIALAVFIITFVGVVHRLWVWNFSISDMYLFDPISENWDVPTTTNQRARKNVFRGRLWLHQEKQQQRKKTTTFLGKALRAVLWITLRYCSLGWDWVTENLSLHC